MKEPYKCPNCGCTEFNLVPTYISQEDYEGEYMTIKCASCKKGNMGFDAGKSDLLEAEKNFIEEELMDQN